MAVYTEGAELDIDLVTGATFQESFTWSNNGSPVDLTGCTATMHIRERLADSSTLVTFTSAAGEITLGGAAGTIVIEKTIPDLTAKRGVWDLHITFPDGDIRRLLYGCVEISRAVTR